MNSKEFYNNLRANLNIGIEDIFMIEAANILSRFHQQVEVLLICGDTDENEVKQFEARIIDPQNLYGSLKGLNGQIYSIKLIVPSEIISGTLEKENIFGNIATQIGTWIFEEKVTPFDSNELSLSMIYEFNSELMKGIFILKIQLGKLL